MYSMTSKAPEEHGFLRLLRWRHVRFLAFLKKICSRYCNSILCNPLTTFGDKKLSEKLANVIKAVNKIKTKALNSRLFHQLCIDNDDDFQCFLLHIEVRWLSKGNCLTRLFTLFYTTLDFFEEVDNNLKKRIAFLTFNSAD